MSCSSDRAQTDPIAALLAVVVIAAALALYVGVLEDVLDRKPDRNAAVATLERVEAHLAPDGVVEPTRRSSVTRVTPDGYEVNVTVTVANGRWSTGPVPAPSGDRATRTVGVRTGPVTVEDGRLRVVVWT